MSRLNNAMLDAAIIAAITAVDSKVTTVDGKVVAVGSSVSTVDGKVDTIGTTTTDVLEESTEVAHHAHPALSRVNPSGRYRRAAATFTTAANNENVVIGVTGSAITYTFKSTLGAPAAANVQVKVQGSVADTIAMLAKAIQGVTDAANIAYGSGTQPHPDVLGYFEKNGLCIGTVQHVAGNNLYLKGKVADRTDASYPFTFTTTATTSLLTAFTRIYSNRYIMTGNNGTLNNRVAGEYQMVMPIGSVLHTDGTTLVKYDPNSVVTEAVNTVNTIYECDFYYSMDGTNFTLMSYGNNLSSANTTAGSEHHPCPTHRVPAGAGLYVKMRSSGTTTNDYVDYKVQFHQYYPGE